MAFDVEKLEDLANEAVTQLALFLRGDITDDKLIKGAKVAASVLSSLMKYKQQDSARDATAVLMAREMAKDSEDFKRYIRVAMPNSPFRPLLTDGSREAMSGTEGPREAGWRKVKQSKPKERIKKAG